MRRHSPRYWTSRLALYLLILAILVYTIFPFYWTFISSLKPSDELFAVHPTYWPTHPTLAHYAQVFQGVAMRSHHAVDIRRSG